MAGAEIGEDCTLGQNVFVADRVRIGNGTKVQNNVSLFEGVELEADVFIGPSAVFTNVKNPRSAHPVGGRYTRTVVARGATIGANATILCGLTVGAYAFVGAGCVVTRDVAPYALIIGNPGRPVGWVCPCGERLEFTHQRATCRRTGNRFELRAGQLHTITAKP